MAITRQVVLASRPTGALSADNFRLQQSELPVPAADELLVRPLWLSLDPMLRLRVEQESLGGALPGWPIGGAVIGPAIGEVIGSSLDSHPVGSMVEGRFPWQDLAVAKAQECRALPEGDWPVETALGALGLPGFTAYVGLSLLADLTAGATILISGASGAVGSLAGQIARRRGMRVIGLTGDAGRADYLTGELGFDAALLRDASDLDDQLKQAAPQGIAGYFDNVGGPLLSRVLPCMAVRGTILICGLMAQYNDRRGSEMTAAAMLETLMGRQLTLRAFSARSFEHLHPQFMAECGPLVAEGSLKLPQFISHGLASAPEAFAAMFGGVGQGKRLVRLDGYKDSVSC